MTEEKIKYKYLIGVRADNEPNLELLLSLDFFIEYTIDQLEILDRWGKTQSLFSVSASQLRDLEPKVKGAVTSLTPLRLRMRFNPSISAHLFNSSFKMERSDFQDMVNLANVDSTIRKKIVEARINL